MRAAGFPVVALLPRAAQGSAQSQASLALQAFWVQVYSQANLMSSISAIAGNAGTNRSIVRPARCVESLLRNGGRVRLRDHRRAESSPILETTIANHESPAPGVGSILRHAREPTQLLYADAGLRQASTTSRADAGRAAHATVIRRSKYSLGPRRAFDPAKNLSKGAQTQLATCGTSRK